MDRACTVDGCDAPYRASGYCRAHYRRWRLYGDPTHVPEARQWPTECAVDGCDRKPLARGLCSRHYQSARVERLGGRRERPSIVERIDAHSEGVAGGCVEWNGHTNTRNGYGRVRYNGRMRLAHNVAWMLWHDADDTPDGLVIRHLCDNRLCVNPLHLEAGTRSQNTHDAVRAGSHISLKLSKHMGDRLRSVGRRHGLDPDVLERVIAELS